RFGLGRSNTMAEVEAVVASLIPLVCELRNASPDGLPDLETCPL
ncbi:MAG: hypothetical protein ACI8W8_004393, partial [Rhodothermales bacterium]